MKIKSKLKEIHWPNKKEIMINTSYVLITTILLSTLIYFWNMGIDWVIKAIVG